MSEAVIINFLILLGTISTGVSAVLVAMFARSRGETKRANATIERVRDQVENSHGTNLRDDLDVMRNEMRGAISTIRATASDVRGIRSDLGRMDRRIIEDSVSHRDLETRFNNHLVWAGEQKDRVDDIERTTPPMKEITK